ncbi:hypothetical protein [Deinococcus fonticola]|uniref:hypothetical protein n=1 Tax=Deinococcus fonticola TaxID=2528713 RepID=UPI00107539A4|nr:hypothetical protein [Deinococcus fonticola]
MGEAKRRKQLGLMPTIFPFEAELTAEAKATLIRGPEDPQLREATLQALESTQLAGNAWASEYRTALVFAGKYQGRLYNAQDVEQIPVPPLRRITGEVVLNRTPAEVDGPALGIPGGVVRLREQRHSMDGKKWESLPPVRDAARVRRIIDENPAFGIDGETIGQFSVEHWAEGRIDVEPEPPAGALEILEDMAREWHGSTPDLWAKYHAELVPEGEAPAVRRTFFELRHIAPLQNPTRGLLSVRGGYEIYPLVDPMYSLDGETWLSYDDPDAEPVEDDFLQAFSEMLNMETVSAVVHADGRVEWDEQEDIPAGQEERIRAELRSATGAGDPEKWASWTRDVMRDTFQAQQSGTESGLTENGEWPVPVAVRLDLAKDALEDPDPLSQTFIESEITFDGETWRDLYDEEMPPELLLAIANMKPNPPAGE